MVNFLSLEPSRLTLDGETPPQMAIKVEAQNLSKIAELIIKLNEYPQEVKICHHVPVSIDLYDKRSQDLPSVSTK